MKKIVIPIIVIIVFLLVGIFISFNKSNISQTTNSISISNDSNLLEFFNTNFNNGMKISDNETICGMIDTVDENVVHISDLYMLRGNTGFQVKEFKEGYINIENISSLLINETNEEIKKEDLSPNHYIIVVTGKLVSNANMNFIIPNRTTLNVIPTYTIYNELNQIINTDKEIKNVEIQSASADNIYCKYIQDYNIDGKTYSLPHIFGVEITENTQWDSLSTDDYKGKNVNIYFDKPIESIEVEYPIATRIECVR